MSSYTTFQTNLSHDFTELKSQFPQTSQQASHAEGEDVVITRPVSRGLATENGAVTEVGQGLHAAYLLRMFVL